MQRLMKRHADRAARRTFDARATTAPRIFRHVAAATALTLAAAFLSLPAVGAEPGVLAAKEARHIVATFPGRIDQRTRDAIRILVPLVKELAGAKP